MGEVAEEAKMMEQQLTNHKDGYWSDGLLLILAVLLQYFSSW